MKWRITQIDSHEWAIDLLMPNGEFFLGNERYNSVVSARFEAVQRYGLDRNNQLQSG